MPEKGEREEPVRVNQEYMEDLIMRGEEESSAKTFISIPSAKILREHRMDHEQREEETDKEWAEVRSALIQMQSKRDRKAPGEHMRTNRKPSRYSLIVVAIIDGSFGVEV